jgi:hypothetical protein
MVLAPHNHLYIKQMRMFSGPWGFQDLDAEAAFFRGLGMTQAG